MPISRSSLTLRVGMGRIPLLASDAVVFEWEFVVLAERMTFPIFWAEDATQVRMIREVDADEIVGFAFVPIGDAPDVRDARNFRQLTGDAVPPARQLHLQFAPVAMRVAVEVIDDFDVRLARSLLLGVGLQPVGTSEIIQRIEHDVFVVMQELRDIGDPVGSDLDPRVFDAGLEFADGVDSELLDQPLMNVFDAHVGFRE